MRRFYSILSSLFFTIVLIYGTTDANISGTVTKTGGGPLKGVAISLAKQASVTATTDSLGKFSLTTVGALQMNSPEVTPLEFTLKGKNVVFSSLSGKISGSVDIFSGNGRKLASTQFTDLRPAVQSVTLPAFLPGFNIVRVTINNTVHTCQIIRMGNELHFIKQQSNSLSGDDFTLAKKATAQAVDTLIATKDKFTTAKKPISSYTLADVAILMDSTTTTDTGAIAWGKKEDPTAGCTVGTMPEYDALTANSKLPDPFKKLDGTRIKNLSEWACRREEILQQMFKYIYGPKPIPAKGSVTGTVSETKISVKVTEGSKTCSFDCTVSMNGATKPAPAIISYSAPVTAPSGVATIGFTAVESTGGSGPKSGPFYDFYGTDHPAGELVAQAWQVSRIIDLLEQNPGIIDPYKLGITGCSRNGKGAFIGGVLDNRIALTLPCESGIGGTVALRLVEQLSTDGEWPYHAISYVRWLSEITLGKFTTGNSASADNTDKLPVDMHEAMALIAPRGLYILDNASTQYSGLDRAAAYVSASIGKKAFNALGMPDNFTYVCTSGNHCETLRSGYKAMLSAMIDKFLLGKTSTKTGDFQSDLSGKPDVSKYYDWDTTAIPGQW